jgi:hypothetical protein
MVVDEGLITLLNNLLNGSSEGLKIRLFKNDLTPDNATTIGDMTEATFPGYNFISANGASFPTPTMNGSAQAESDGVTMTWTCSGTPMPAETIYGLYVTMPDIFASDKLLFAARFATPIDINASGQEVNKIMNWFTQDLEV